MNRLWQSTFLIIPNTYCVKVAEVGKKWACVKLGIRNIQSTSPAFLGRFPYAPFALHVLIVLLSRCLLLVLVNITQLGFPTLRNGQLPKEATVSDLLLLDAYHMLGRWMCDDSQRSDNRRGNKSQSWSVPRKCFKSCDWRKTQRFLVL